MCKRFTAFVFQIASLLSLVVLTQSCLKSDNPGLPAGVVDAIAQTGHNRVELTKTVGYFIDTDDSIFFEICLFFLIANMPPHQYAVDYSIKKTKKMRKLTLSQRALNPIAK